MVCKYCGFFNELKEGEMCGDCHEALLEATRKMVCPHCGSGDVYYMSIKNEWMCGKCQKRWEWDW
jgi:hypothetical protein